MFLIGLIFHESQKKNANANITTLKELLFPDEIVDVDYSRLFFALKNKNIDALFAPNAWTLLNSIKLLFDQWDSLFNDIEEEILTESDKFSKEIEENLMKQISPDQERANELRAIFKSNTPKDVIKQIWPNLKKIICDTTASYKIYVDQLMKNYLPDIDIENSFLAINEALIGKSIKSKGKFKLNLDFMNLFLLMMKAVFF